MDEESDKTQADSEPTGIEESAAGEENAQNSRENTQAEAAAPEEPSGFDLADDLMQLEKLNLLRAVMIRIQSGRHPNSKIDALLKRHMDIAGEDPSIKGPYAIRLVCTVMAVFVVCCMLWFSLWLIASSFELNYFIRLLSTGLATLFAAVVGIAVFHPTATPDEKLVKQMINRRLELIRKELNDEARQKENDKSENVTENDSEIDATADEDYIPASDSETESNDQTEDNMPQLDEQAKKLALEGSDDIES